MVEGAERLYGRHLGRVSARWFGGGSVTHLYQTAKIMDDLYGFLSPLLDIRFAVIKCEPVRRGGASG